MIRNTMITSSIVPSGQTGQTTTTEPTVSSVIDGKVSTFSQLPSAFSSNGKVYLVTQSTGIVFINRRERGLYISDGTNWSLIGDWSAIMKDTDFVMWDDEDPTKKMRFELSTVGHNSTRVVTMPDESVNLGDVNSTKNDVTAIKNQLVARGSSFTFNSDGQLSAINSSAGTKLFTYTDGRLTHITGSGIYKSKSFVYDDDGKLQSISIL